MEISEKGLKIKTIIFKINYQRNDYPSIRNNIIVLIVSLILVGNS
mgnify:CR=1 FL=1